MLYGFHFQYLQKTHSIYQQFILNHNVSRQFIDYYARVILNALTKYIAYNIQGIFHVSLKLFGISNSNNYFMLISGIYSHDFELYYISSYSYL